MVFDCIFRDTEFFTDGLVGVSGAYQFNNFNLARGEIALD